MIKLVMFSLVFFISTLSQARTVKRRKPSSEYLGIAMSYLTSKKVPLKIHINHYGEYVEFKGVEMSCDKQSVEDSVNWSCAGEADSGSLEVEFKQGFKLLRVFNINIRGKSIKDSSFMFQVVKTQ